MLAEACTSPTRCWSSWLCDQSAHPAATVGGVNARPAAIRKLDGARPPPTGPPTLSSNVAEMKDPAVTAARPGWSGCPSHTPCRASATARFFRSRWTTARIAAAGLSSACARSIRTMSSKGRMDAELARGDCFQTGSWRADRRRRGSVVASRVEAGVGEPDDEPLEAARTRARRRPDDPVGVRLRLLGRVFQQVLQPGHRVVVPGELGAPGERGAPGPHQLVRDGRPARVGDDPELDAPGVDLLRDLVAQLALLQVAVE